MLSDAIVEFLPEQENKPAQARNLALTVSTSMPGAPKNGPAVPTREYESDHASRNPSGPPPAQPSNPTRPAKTHRPGLDNASSI
jgi:hypothetical protein